MIIYIAYLSEAMEKGTSVDELIKSFTPGGARYNKGLKQLQERYGRDEMLREVCVRDLLSIVLLKLRLVNTSLRKLYDHLEAEFTRRVHDLGNSIRDETWHISSIPLGSSPINLKRCNG
ncbi:hypothetical protein AVEN_137785-1 [Araneus ventricosus]|uniref:Uncharacterized protein n=1 Tax=Araneus ventricosus TaxID=182803 RepID=A0A4Y2W1R6_ARAVE|nr:hypothetical protein AVEN_137785-1 [Araneus ventricosus]